MGSKLTDLLPDLSNNSELGRMPSRIFRSLKYKLKDLWARAKSYWRTLVSKRLVIALITVTILVSFVYIGSQFGWSWVGLGEFKLIKSSTNEEVVFYRPPKTLWDFLEAAILPALAALVIYTLDHNDKKAKQRIADEERKQAALTGFIDRVSDLILNQSNIQERGEDNTHNNHVHEMIHARLLEVVKGLDGSRKAQLFEFLQGLELILLKANLDKNDDDSKDENDSGLQEQPRRFPDSLLDGVDFSGVELKNTKLARMELSGVRMKSAHLVNVDFSNCILRSVDFDETVMEAGYFKDSDLENLSCQNATFNWVNMNKAVLKYSNWTYCVFTDGIINEAHLHGAKLNGTKFKRVKLFKAKLLQNVEMRKVKWQDVDLTEAELEDADLTEATFVNTQFDGARLVRTKFQNADLRGCSMKGAVLRGARLDGARLSSMIFAEVKDFSRCHFHKSRIDSEISSGEQGLNKWFIVWQLVNKQTQSIIHIDDLQDADLTNLDLRNRNFLRCKMQGVDLSNSNLEGSDLRGADLTSSSIGLHDFEEGTILRNTNLKKCKFNNALLMGAILDGADLSGANLSGANLIGASLKNTRLHNAIIDENTCFDPKGMLVWQAVNRQLDDVDLMQKSLSDANLEDADLSGKICSGTTFDKTNLSGVSFRDCRVDSASFRLAVLDRADFTGANGLNVEEIKKQASSYKGTIWPV
ncbi:MAG: pentapeptide repeat-containing protein [Chloroflexi bacterium]|nr:pentapeptide repeat-containing protein [Chloroflexota bacterium]